MEISPFSAFVREELSEFRKLAGGLPATLSLSDTRDSNLMNRRNTPQNRPLIDSEWLLGKSPPSRLSQIRRHVFPLAIICGISAGLVLLGPSASRWWLRLQLLEQFHSAESPADQELAVISLAEMLPESTPQLVLALACADLDASKLAYDALERYVETIANLDETHKSTGYAHVLHAISQSLSLLKEDRKAFAVAIVSKIETRLQNHAFPGSSVLLSTCKTVLGTARVDGTRVAKSSIALEQGNGSVATDSSPKAIIKFKDDGYSQDQSRATVAIDRPKLSVNAEPKVIHPSLSHMAGQKFRADVAVLPTPLVSDASKESASKPVTPSIAIPTTQQAMETTPVTDVDLAIQVPVFKSPKSFQATNARISTASLVNTPNVFDSDLLDSAPPIESQEPVEEQKKDSVLSNDVVGIDRQRTEDLVALLGSVRTRVASAALYELERRGMSPLQLEIAVDLARGSAESRILSLDRLVQQQEFDPTPWLGWLAADRERTVRMRAISLLGSLNSESARTKLRLLLTRERDDEISRSIHQILLSSSRVRSSSTLNSK